MNASTISVKMRDLVPYKHGVLCTLGDSTTPVVNDVVALRWCEDGKRMSAMLESHNFIIKDADEVVDYVVENQNLSEYYQNRVANWVAPARPGCPTRGHEVES